MPQTIKVPNTDVSAFLVKPSGKAKGSVIVIHEVWGLTDHIKSIADRIAAEGYIALAPDLLSEAGVDVASLVKLQTSLFDPKKRNEVQPVLRKLMAPIQSPDFSKKTTKALKSCFEYLYELPESDKKVAVIGFCFGGSYSFSLAVEEPRLVLALPFYGHSDYSVDQLSRIKCPVFAFYGEKDERLVDGLDDLTKKMASAKVDFHYKVYPDCGHAFFNDTNPYAYNEAAANDAWKLCLELLAKNTQN